MSHRDDLQRALSTSLPTSTGRSFRVKSEPQRVVVYGDPGRSGRYLVAAFVAVAAAAGSFALAHADEISSALRNRGRVRAARPVAAAQVATAAAPASSAPCSELESAVAALGLAAGECGTPEAAPSAADDEPTRFLVSRTGEVAASARADETARVERTYEVAVAVGPEDASGAKEALVQFGRATGRVVGPDGEELEVSSAQPLPLDPARRRLGAWITAPGDAEIGVRLDAAGHIVEIAGLDVARREAVRRAWDASLCTVFAEALDEASIRSLLEGVLSAERSASPTPAAGAPGAARATPVTSCAGGAPATPSPAPPARRIVRRVGAWPSEIE